jgi:EAL domain-containing protein (putative c-di-GMP-specific phosphodiesterase class I)
MLAIHGLPPDRLVLEVAEPGLEDAAALGDRVAALRSAGVRTALDEFGAGAASLAHLRSLPIDMVKVGRSFFEDATPMGTTRHGRVPAARTSRDALPLIDVLIGVGRRLGVDVVAHGLEAPAQLELVRTAGCRIGQGHLFARPQPAERIEAYLDGFPARIG